jgi:hypothetical protein
LFQWALDKQGEACISIVSPGIIKAIVEYVQALEILRLFESLMKITKRLVKETRTP